MSTSAAEFQGPLSGARSRFVIVAAPRTGSNLLCTLLDSHPEILCHHEVFNPRGIFFALGLRDGALDLGSLDARDADPLGFLDRLWRVPTACRCVGFKMTRGQCEPVLRHVLAERAIGKIVLRRRNRVKTLVSELVAQRTDRWELYGAEERGEPPRVRVDVEALRAHVAENAAFYDTVVGTLDASGQPYVELEYETLGCATEQRRALEFLGVGAPDLRLTPRSVKQTPADLRRVVANFAELDSALSGTEYHRELHDPGE